MANKKSSPNTAAAGRIIQPRQISADSCSFDQHDHDGDGTAELNHVVTLSEVLFSLRRYIAAAALFALLLCLRKYLDARPLSVGIDFGSTESCVAQFDSGSDQNRVLFCTKSWITQDFYQRGGRLASSADNFDELCSRPGADCIASPKFVLSMMEDSDNESQLFADLDNAQVDGKPLGRVLELMFKYLVLKSSAAIDCRGGPFSQCKIKHVVLSVPADYSMSKRKYLASKARSAGLNILGIISEPTAAALGYGLHADSQQKRAETDDALQAERATMRDVMQWPYLVFDFGGGTLDISITNKQGNMFTTINAGGKNLGGQQFTECLAEMIRGDQKLQSSRVNIDSEHELMRYAEEVKQVLSAENGEINSLFEAFCSKHFDSIVDALNNFFLQTTFDAEKLHGVILTGGATLMPRVKELLDQYFKHSVKIYGDNPITAVAAGNAIYSSVLQDGSPLKWSAVDVPGFKKLAL